MLLHLRQPLTLHLISAKAKAWQFYIEPAMIWTLGGYNGGTHAIKYNVNNSGFQLNVGFNYKFKNSNGTHNFTIAELRDQSEIDGLNAKINDLRSDLNGKDAQLAAKDRQIADLQKALDECNRRPKYEKPATANQPASLPVFVSVQGKSE